MTTATQPPRARLRVLLLAALTGLVALLLGAGTASATSLPAAQTRVGAIHPTVTTVVGVAEHIAAGQHRVRAPSQPQIASGQCVAAEAEGAGTTQLFRHVDPKELADIRATGSFRSGGSGMSGKFFAETPEHAAQWGARLNGGEGAVVGTDVPNSFAEQLMRWE